MTPAYIYMPYPPIVESYYNFEFSSPQSMPHFIHLGWTTSKFNAIKPKLTEMPLSLCSFMKPFTPLNIMRHPSFINSTGLSRSSTDIWKPILSKWLSAVIIKSFHPPTPSALQHFDAIQVLDQCYTESIWPIYEWAY